MSEKEKNEKDMYSYTFPKDKNGKVRISLAVDPTAYSKLEREKQQIEMEKDQLEAVLDSLALEQFDSEVQRLRNAGVPEDELENIDPNRLEYLKGKYESRLGQKYVAETPGQAVTNDYTSSLGLRDEFSSGAEMGLYLMEMAKEKQGGVSTLRAQEAQKRLDMLGKKFWDSLASATTTQKIEIPIRPILRIGNKTYPHIVGKNEKSEHSSSTEAITKEGR